MPTLVESVCHLLASTSGEEQSLREYEQRMADIERRRYTWMARRAATYTGFVTAVTVSGLMVLGCTHLVSSPASHASPPTADVVTETLPSPVASGSGIRGPVLPSPTRERHFGIDQQSQQEMLLRERGLNPRLLPGNDLLLMQNSIRILQIQIRELQQAVFQIRQNGGTAAVGQGFTTGPAIPPATN